MSSLTSFLADETTAKLVSGAMPKPPNKLTAEKLSQLIYEIRDQRVVLDSDLAAIYGVETKALNRAVKRNADRFPKDFMFQLTRQESEVLRYQFGTLKTGRDQHRKYLPYVLSRDFDCLPLRCPRPLPAAPPAREPSRSRSLSEFGVAPARRLVTPKHA